MNLNFKGPFHWDHLVNSKNPNSLNLLNLNNKSGIYIWGFVYDLDTNGNLNQIIDFSTKTGGSKHHLLKSLFKIDGCDISKAYSNGSKFIPYYVGLINGSISSRLNNHHSVRTNDNAKKYLRLKLNFYKEFFKINSGFEIFIKNKELQQYKNHTALVLKNKNSIDYFNNFCLLYTINKNIKPKTFFTNQNITDVPITDCFIIGNQIPDTLDYIVSDNSQHSKNTFKKNSLNNFWFCYAELPDGYSANEEMEAQTFYSLNGKTISKTLPYRNKGFGHTITCNSSDTSMSPCIDIFNHDSTTKEVIPQDPDDPKSFPGY